MNEGTLARPQEGVAKMKEVSGETGQVGGSRLPQPAGVYRHPANPDATVIALDDPITGDAQARGFVRAGFEWVRDARPDEVKIVGLPSNDHASQPERQLDATSEELKGLRARLAALEAQEDKRKEQEAQSQTATELSQERAQEAAQEQTDARGTDNTGSVNGVNAQDEPTNTEEVEKRRPGRPAKNSGEKESK
jgi:hypothetical protein